MKKKNKSSEVYEILQSFHYAIENTKVNTYARFLNSETKKEITYIVPKKLDLKIESDIEQFVSLLQSGDYKIVRV